MGIAIAFLGKASAIRPQEGVFTQDGNLT